MTYHVSPLKSTFQTMGFITLMELWWIAVWGIAYIVIQHFTGGSRQKELFIYGGIVGMILLTLGSYPELVKHLT